MASTSMIEEAHAYGKKIVRKWAVEIIGKPEPVDIGSSAVVRVFTHHS